MVTGGPAPAGDSVPAYKVYADRYFMTRAAFDLETEARSAGVKDGIVRRDARLKDELMTVIDGLRARIEALEDQVTRP